MKCPFCGDLENRVIDSRLSLGGEVTRRRRECEACERRYTTYERIERALPLVLKGDGRKQPFDRSKAIAGVRRASIKRPVTDEAVEKLVDRVEGKLVESADPVITSSIIGELILGELKGLDPVAYVRFASVYRQFANVQEFTSALEKLVADDEHES